MSSFRCIKCKRQNDIWRPFCPICGERGLVSETFIVNQSKVAADEAEREAKERRPKTFRDHKPLSGERLSTGIPGMDFVLGCNRNDPKKRYGLHKPSFVLFGGVAGTGKTSLILKMLAAISKLRPLYISSEQTLGEIRANAEGMQLGDSFLDVYAKNCENLDDALELAHDLDSPIMVIDSLNNLTDPPNDTKDVFRNKLKIAYRLKIEMETYGRIILCVSHLNADEKIVGLQEISHACSAVMILSNVTKTRRKLECPTKNRFGHPGAQSFFEMTEMGLVPCEPPKSDRDDSGDEDERLEEEEK